jgi:hypothetical protein
VTQAFVVGYDPGGNENHGVAALRVRREYDEWKPLNLQTATHGTLENVLGWVDGLCKGRRIVAAGVDTLTEWNAGRSGLRPADRWLRGRFTKVAGSVVPPNALYGSMVVNGAAFLTALSPRFQRDETVVTEAHPKVLYFATTGKRCAWDTDSTEMAVWLADQLGIEECPDLLGPADHRFDAGVSVLAALKGLNREWPLDLHALPSNDQGRLVRFCGRTHYWWPN